MRIAETAPARVGLLVALAVLGIGATGYWAWAGDAGATAESTAEATVSGMVPLHGGEAHAAPAEVDPGVSPGSVPLTTCSLGCDGSH